MILKTMLGKIFQNELFPFDPRRWKFGHALIILIVLILAFLKLAFVPVEGKEEDLYKQAFRELEKRGIQEEDLTEKLFNRRTPNLWLNLAYYKKYSEKLKDFFQGQRPKIPRPFYPLLSHFLYEFKGVHLLSPSNLVEIAVFLRKNLSSGITIRTEDRLLSEIVFSSLEQEEVLEKQEGVSNRQEEVLKLLKDYTSVLEELFQLSFFFSEEETDVGNAESNRRIEKSYMVSYKKKLSFPLKRIPEKIELRYNPKALERLGVSDYIKTHPEEELLFSESPRSFQEFHSSLRRLWKKMARVYTIVLKGEKKQKRIVFRLDQIPSFNSIMSRQKEESFHTVSLYMSKVLQYRPNSREFVDFSLVPDLLHKAFVLVEDDYFYFQMGGVDPVGLMKASYNYLFHGSKKGNASITEQIYESYLGLQRKTPYEKFLQILGAVYLSYLTPDREQILDLYIQSIPGSFWRDHNYGVKGIIKSYLDKNSLGELTLKELAWLTRVALSPNIFGQDYIRFSLIRRIFDREGVNIMDDQEIQSFVSQLTDEQKNFIRVPRKETKESELQVIRRLRKSFIATEKQIQKALWEFYWGNEWIDPLISLEQLKEALSSRVEFRPSSFIFEYPSYTDQTREDIRQFVGNWGFNAGMDVVVAFDERAQKILDDELLISTESVPLYKREKKTEIDPLTGETEEEKIYGGAAVLIETHSIEDAKPLNRILAIASRHSESNYFNWAVSGHRHFGSILKWLVLLLYLDSGGTLLDEFYDIPRSFEYLYSEDSEGNLIYRHYQPDNWHKRDDPYGFFTYKKEHTLYNFIQSKNNTFVRLADLVGLEKLSRFLNHISSLNEEKDPRRRFQPIYPIALGSQEISPVRMAQSMTVLSNRGIFRPVSTLNRFVQADGSDLVLNLDFMEESVVSRESAEASLFAGYLNTFYGTARRFIPGGVAKTGSADTDVSFLAMTARTNGELTQDSHYRSNLLYLVNIGVNEGKIDDGLYGGTITAVNSKKVFERILWNPKTRKQEPISGDFVRYFSPNFEYYSIPGYAKIWDKRVLSPVLKNSFLLREADLPYEELAAIRDEYMARTDEERIEEYGIELAKEQGLDYYELSEMERLSFRERASVEIYNEYDYIPYYYQYETWLLDQQEPSQQSEQPEELASSETGEIEEIEILESDVSLEKTPNLDEMVLEWIEGEVSSQSPGRISSDLNRDEVTEDIILTERVETEEIKTERLGMETLETKKEKEVKRNRSPQRIKTIIEKLRKLKQEFSEEE